MKPNTSHIFSGLFTISPCLTSDPWSTVGITILFREMFIPPRTGWHYSTCSIEKSHKNIKGQNQCIVSSFSRTSIPEHVLCLLLTWQKGVTPGSLTKRKSEPKMCSSSYLLQNKKRLPELESQLSQDSTDLILVTKTIVTYMTLHLLTRLNLVKNSNFSRVR